MELEPIVLYISEQMEISILIRIQSRGIFFCLILTVKR